ncbi:Hypk [Scenedesmus sp. PABB004]|nr:Hypk [Scenedesmus sp. PABB004]
MAKLMAAQKADKEAQIKREKELAAVKVTAADIDVVAAEAEVDRKLAERRLREHGGNLVEALKSWL